MFTKKIRFTKMEDIKNFVQAASKCEFDIDLISGKYIVDAKSIMGIFSLDISKELTLQIHAPQTDEAVKVFEEACGFA